MWQSLAKITEIRFLSGRTLNSCLFHFVEVQQSKNFETALRIEAIKILGKSLATWKRRGIEKIEIN